MCFVHILTYMHSLVFVFCVMLHSWRKLWSLEHFWRDVFNACSASAIWLHPTPASLDFSFNQRSRLLLLMKIIFPFIKTIFLRDYSVRQSKIIGSIGERHVAAAVEKSSTRFRLLIEQMKSFRGFHSFVGPWINIYVLIKWNFRLYLELRPQTIRFASAG